MFLNTMATARVSKPENSNNFKIILEFLRITKELTIAYTVDAKTQTTSYGRTKNIFKTRKILWEYAVKKMFGFSKLIIGHAFQGLIKKDESLNE